MRVVLFTALLVGVDQLTKYSAIVYLKPWGSLPVHTSFFSLTYVENCGAAWGIFAGYQTLLILFSLLTLLVLVWRWQTLFAHLKFAELTMTLIFGGITGNLIDRIWRGRVIDFIDFHWHNSHFPAFNVADAAIFCGVVLYVIGQWLYEKHSTP